MTQIIKAMAVHLTFLMAQLTVGAWFKSEAVPTNRKMRPGRRNSTDVGNECYFAFFSAYLISVYYLVQILVANTWIYLDYK